MVCVKMSNSKTGVKMKNRKMALKMRISKTEVRIMFQRLLKALGKKEDVGSCDGLVLDYATKQGGYVIEELKPECVCTHPFGSRRRTAKEMYLSMLMTAQALETLTKI